MNNYTDHYHNADGSLNEDGDLAVGGGVLDIVSSGYEAMTKSGSEGALHGAKAGLAAVTVVSVVAGAPISLPLLALGGAYGALFGYLD